VAANAATVEPAVVVLSSTDTDAAPRLLAIRSGRPSPFTSLAARPLGELPATRSTRGANVTAVAPIAVVFSSTDSVPVLLATARSRPVAVNIVDR
jgi:hypothetical protein